MQRVKVLLAAFLLVAIAGGSWLLLGPRAPQGEASVYRFGVHAGDELAYNMTVRVYVDGSLNRTQSDVARVRVVSFSPPLVELNFSDSAGGPAGVPYGVIALPLDEVGLDSVSVPVAVGYTWVCLDLRRAGYTEGPLGRSIVYDGSLAAPNLTLTARVTVDESTGIVVDFSVNVSVAKWSGGSITVSLSQVLSDYKLSGGEPVEAPAPGGFVCRNGFSNDLRFTLEGLYLVEGGSARPLCLDDFEGAAASGTVLAVLDKRDPASSILWESLINATKEAGARVYVLVYDSSSRLLTPDMVYVVSNIVQPALNRLDNPRLPLLLRLGPGGVEAVESGSLSYGDVLAFIRGG